MKIITYIALVYGASALKLHMEQEQAPIPESTYLEQEQAPIPEPTYLELDEAPEKLSEVASESQLLELDNEAEADVEFHPTSCKSGLERALTGFSNTWSEFKQGYTDGKLWKDPQFQADNTSLNWSMYGYPNDGSDTPPYGLSWMRPSEMGAGYTKSPSLYGNLGKPVPDGTQQANLGDCWFLSANAALAEVPERVYEYIWNRKYSEDGIFRFKFWLKDRYVHVNIDDRLPCVKHSYSNAPNVHYYRPWTTQRSAQDAWWVPMVEKAFAKLNQNYDRIIGGWGDEAMRALTGLPTQSLHYSMKPEAKALMDRNFGIINEWAKKQFPMTSACFHSHYGLVSGHAYALLGVAELKDAAGNVVHRIVRMRNPWGSEKYHGPFSDHSDLWTKEWADQVGLKQKDDGQFWMPYDVYLISYQYTAVTMYQKYLPTRSYDLSVGHINTPGMVKIKVSNPVAQQLYFTGDLYPARIFPRGKKCAPDNQLVIQMTDSSGKSVGPDYAWVGQKGYGTVGEYAADLPAGDYEITMYNEAPGKAPLAFHVYAEKEYPGLR